MKNKEELDDRFVGFAWQIVCDPAAGFSLVAANCIGESVVHPGVLTLAAVAP
jgi:hypothetical protein